MYEGVSAAVIEGEERQQSLESVDRLQNNQIRLDVCQEEANRHISLAAEQIQLYTNIEDDDWSTQVKTIQKETLELQRKLSAEFKPEQLNDHLLLSHPPTSSSKLSRLKLTSAAPKVTPNDKAERQVLELKEQLLSIEPLLKNANETGTDHHSRREELKLKLKARQKQQLKNMETSQSVIIEDGTNTRPNVPVKAKKALAPQPPQKTTLTSPQMQSMSPQSPKTPSKQFGPTTLGIIPRPTSFGAQWKRMQRSKSVKFLSDSSPLRKNLRGIKRAFKTSEDILASPSPTPPSTPRRNSIAVTEGIDWPDTTLAHYLEPLELPIAEDCSSPIYARKMSEAVNGPKNRFKYLPEIAEMISTMTGTDFDNEEDAARSVSSDSEGEEEQAISENALKEIEAFEKLIADYMREKAQQMSSSEDLSQEGENYIS